MGLLESERGCGAGVEGAVVVFGWRLHRGDYDQASLHRHFKIQFGRIEIFFDLEFINVECLGSNSTMVG